MPCESNCWETLEVEYIIIDEVKGLPIKWLFDNS